MINLWDDNIIHPGADKKKFTVVKFLKIDFLLSLQSKLPDRLMAGLQILVLTVLVRIQLGQLKKHPSRVLFLF